jgi:integrase
MPNPNPVRRPRVSARSALPPGYGVHKEGGLRYRFTDPRTGRRREVYGRTVEAIQEKLRLPIPVAHDPKLTVARYLRSWLANREGIVRPNTLHTDREVVERNLIPLLGERLLLKDLSAEHVQAMLVDLRAHRTKAGLTKDGQPRPGRPYSPRTIAIIRGTLRKALAAAVPDRIATNPAIAVRMPPAKKTARRVGVDIPVPSIAVLRAVEQRLRARADRLHPLFVVASTTGVRQSELLGLRWSSVDLERRRIDVRAVLLRDTHTLDDPKSESSARPIRLAPLVADALRARRQEQRLDRIAAGSRWCKDQDERDLVFTDELGQPLRGRQVTRRFQRHLEALGLPRFDWKSLRHAYVTGLLEDGVDLAIVSKSAGHASTDITSDIYAHYTRKMQEQVAEVAAARVLG